MKSRLAALSEHTGTKITPAPVTVTSGTTAEGTEVTEETAQMTTITETAARPDNTETEGPSEIIRKASLGLIAVAVTAVLLIVFLIAVLIAVKQRFAKRKEENILPLDPFDPGAVPEQKDNSFTAFDVDNQDELSDNKGGD